MSGDRRVRSGFASAVRFVIVGVIVAVLVLGPAYLFMLLTVQKPPDEHPLIVDQVDVEGRDVDPQLIARLEAAPSDPQQPPAVITYHDITEDSDSPYTVTPQDFADQMRLLHDSGWHTLTVDEFVAWLGGAPLPPHSILVTFDDGARGVWRYADPVLRRYGQHGVAFVITGFVGTNHPYYMTWSELELMEASGHWDVEAHTDLGHTDVIADSTGRSLPFLATTMWLPDSGRVETLEEYTDRVRSDLQHCIARLVMHGLPRPQLFAYPFSAAGEGAVRDQLKATVGDLYTASFLDSTDPPPNTRDAIERREFQRASIVSATTPTSFVSSIEGLLHRPVPTLDPVSWRQEKWFTNRLEPVQIAPSGPIPLTEALTGNEWGEIQLDPDHTSFWTNYRFTSIFSELDTDVGGSAFVLMRSTDNVQVTVKSDSYLVFQGSNEGQTEVVARGKLPDEASRHAVTVTVRPGAVSVAIDDLIVGEFSTDPASRGGIAVGGHPRQQPRPPDLEDIMLEPLADR